MTVVSNNCFMRRSISTHPSVQAIVDLAAQPPSSFVSATSAANAASLALSAVVTGMSGKSFGPPPLGGNSVPEPDLHPVVSSVCNTLELEPDVRFRRVAKLAHAEAIRRWRILQHMRLCRRRSNNLARSLAVIRHRDMWKETWLSIIP